MIPFSKPSITAVELAAVADSLQQKLCGDGGYTQKVKAFFAERFGIKNFLLTASGSAALDMSALLLDLKPGDEVILPSYTFVSTANAIVLRGATPVFCDVEPDTMNINPELIPELITPRTKAIYVVHYAGRICAMDKILAIAKKHHLYVVEDAAQAVGSYDKKGRPAGAIGDLGCYSFHETKNYTMGEGGALIVNNPELLKRAEIIREKGTNRSQFLRGQVDKYTWQDVGSSFLPADVLAALLYGQLQRFDEIMTKRQAIWDVYWSGLNDLAKQGKITLQKKSAQSAHPEHNAHMFYLLTRTPEERDRLLSYLKDAGYLATYHYIPLHNAPFAQRQFPQAAARDLPVTTDQAARLVRLPLYADLPLTEAAQVVNLIKKFYTEQSS